MYALMFCHVGLAYCLSRGACRYVILKFRGHFAKKNIQSGLRICEGSYDDGIVARQAMLIACVGLPLVPPKRVAEYCRARLGQSAGHQSPPYIGTLVDTCMCLYMTMCMHMYRYMFM